MLDKISQLWNEKLNLTKEERQDEDRQLIIATVVLFLEMIHADFEVLPEENRQLQRILSQQFQFSNNQIQTLLKQAESQRTNRQDIWLFTNSIKKHLSREQKLQLMENLWRLIFADDTVDKYEDSLIRKITTLIGLEHADMIQTKLKVKEELNK